MDILKKPLMPCISSVFILIILTLNSTTIQAQTLEHSVGGTVADSLMKDWVQMWNNDDIDAVEKLYADEVVLHADTLSTGLAGKPAVLAATAQRMANTGPLVIEPDHSFQRGKISYQTGRFLINGETGAYTFIFRRTADEEWKLKYTYYLHDKLAASGS